MKNRILLGLAAVALGTAGTATAANIQFDQNVTSNVIYGSGNTNGSFTTDRENGIELGLRGKLRYNASGQPENTFNSNGNGTYTFNAGVAPTQSSPTAVWSFDWSINSDYLNTSGFDLNDFNYTLGLDSDATQGTNFFSFDPINGVNPAFSVVAWDHSLGDNSTGQGLGVESTSAADYATNIATYSLAQNSWKAHWYIPLFNPSIDGTYDIFLKAFDKTSGNLLASTNIQIIVGQGGAPVVPIPGAAGLGMLGMGLVGYIRRRKAG